MDDLATLRQELDAILTDFVQLQTTCMLLQHEGCNRIRANDSEGGLIMLDAVRRMREKVKEQKDSLLDSAGQAEYDAACDRIGFNKKLFSSVSDSVIKDNTLYFGLPARPADSAYKCDEITCKAKVFALARDYFPSLYGQAA